MHSSRFKTMRNLPTIFWILCYGEVLFSTWKKPEKYLNYISYIKAKVGKKKIILIFFFLNILLCICVCPGRHAHVYSVHMEVEFHSLLAVPPSWHRRVRISDSWPVVLYVGSEEPSSGSCRILISDTHFGSFDCSKECTQNYFIPDVWE